MAHSMFIPVFLLAIIGTCNAAVFSVDLKFTSSNFKDNETTLIFESQGGEKVSTQIQLDKIYKIVITQPTTMYSFTVHHRTYHHRSQEEVNIELTREWKNSSIVLDDRSLLVFYRLACPEYVYGSSCEVFCIDSEGRYKCGQDGEKICLNEWSGLDCEISPATTSTISTTTQAQTGMMFNLSEFPLNILLLLCSINSILFIIIIILVCSLYCIHHFRRPSRLHLSDLEQSELEAGKDSRHRQTPSPSYERYPSPLFTIGLMADSPRSLPSDIC